MIVMCTARCVAPVPGKKADEKDKPRDRRENECKIVTEAEIKEK